ncbi:MAG: type II toxin-antitoxin system RatA family toxin [Halothiobacillaceae bacterium]|nr:MAG: type II toxin-antitoxin system RatA family toxin [Halothiobacillaceae bacterium]
MTLLHREALVPYTPNEMFTLVSAVEDYHQFLPWCSDSKRLAQGEDEIKATVTISKGALKKSFTTRNLLQQDKMIEMRLLDGPFKHLHGFWRFEPVGEGGCKISLDLEFQFSNKLIELAIGPVFTGIAGELVQSFHKRAEDVYGRRI